MDNSKQKSRSLIMCTTPLQMLIAEKIIQLNQNEKFDLILIINGNLNGKFKNYFNRLKVNTCKSMMYELKNVSKAKKIKKFLEFKKNYHKWSNFNYSSYYLASIDNTFFIGLFLKNLISLIFILLMMGLRIYTTIAHIIMTKFFYYMIFFGKFLV